MTHANLEVLTEAATTYLEEMFEQTYGHSWNSEPPHIDQLVDFLRTELELVFTILVQVTPQECVDRIQKEYLEDMRALIRDEMEPFIQDEMRNLVVEDLALRLRIGLDALDEMKDLDLGPGRPTEKSCDSACCNCQE